MTRFLFSNPTKLAPTRRSFGCPARSMCRLLPCAAVLAIASYANAAARQADFNGDGIADLACSARSEQVSGHQGAGAVHVFYGKAGVGLSTSDDQFLTQDTSGINGTAGPNEYFGEAMAVGDFNGDGFSDLAIGVPQDTISGVGGAGSVNVLYGSASGLKTSGDQLWHRDSDGVLGDLQANAYFGSALAAGDYDGDGHDDLAIGVVGQFLNGFNNAGEVHVLYGSNSGLTASGDQIFNQDTTGIDEDAGDGDRFGSVLVAGNFDGDSRDDLAIGVAFEDLGATTTAGAVHVLYGRSSGLDVIDAQFFTQDTNGVSGDPGPDHVFGAALCTGDFDHNGKDDLVIAAPHEMVSAVGSAGAVHVFYGSSNGLRTDTTDYWHQDVPGIPDSAEGGGEFFGYAVAAGDFDNDGRDDLAIGIPNEGINGTTNAGAVHVLRGGSNGLTATGDQFWHQNSNGIADTAQDDDFFGGALAAGDYNDDGRDDLAIGVVEETVSGQSSAGALAVIFGGSGGLKSSGNQFFHQNSSGIPDSAAPLEYFGGTLR